MKFLLFAFALIISRPALAESWYMANVNNNPALPSCVALNESPQDFIGDLQKTFGEKNVNIVTRETLKDGGKFIGIVANFPGVGPGQIPLSSTLDTCMAMRPAILKVEAILVEQRKAIANTPWYFVYTDENLCSRAADLNKKNLSPEAYAKIMAHAFGSEIHEQVNIQYNADKSVAVLSYRSGDDMPVKMARGEATCRRELAASHP